MDKNERRHHTWADGLWKLHTVEEAKAVAKTVKSKDAIADNTVLMALLMDLRALSYDLLDQQKETNRILGLAFGVREEK